MKLSLFWQVILTRFGKAFLLSALSAMIIILPAGMGDWSDLSNWINSLVLAGLFGGISGLLQALEKASRWSE